MSERGVFAVDRGVFEHPKFKDEKAPLSKLEAWVWLLANAAWKPHRRRVSGHDFDLKRGQLVASTRFLAEAWRWKEPRVRRFLALLKTDAENDAEIDAHTDAGVTVITIRKYDAYQRVSLPSDAPKDAACDAPADAGSTQDRRKVEDKEYKELDGGGDARPLVSEQASSIADEVATICGHDLKFLPPAWMGAPMRVQTWLSQWPREIILAACREAIAKKRDGPPDSINYFEKAIARFAAKQSAPLPEVKIQERETIHVVREGSKPSGIMAAIDQHIEQFRRSEDEDCRAREGPPRLLSHG